MIRGYIFILVAFVLFPACSELGAGAEQQTIVLDQYRLTEYELQLVNNNGTISLKALGGNIEIIGDLDLEPPCYFVRSNKQVQSYSYEDRGIDKLVLVVGNRVDEDILEKYNIEKKTFCGADLQGILLKPGQIICSEKKMTGGVVCRDYGSDEKNFSYFAY